MGDLHSALPLATSVLAVLWFGFGCLMPVGYRFARARLLCLLPGPRSRVILIVSALPLGIGLALTGLVFTPWAGGHLVKTHCHGDLHCETHVPTILSDPVAYGCMVLAALLAWHVLFHLSQILVREMRIRQNLSTLAGESRKDFRLIDTPEPIAFSLGIFRSTVFVSRGLIQQTSSDELQVILQHEQAHGRRRDNLRNILASVGTLVFPVPIRRQLLTDLRMAAEQCCDAHAASALADSVLVAQTLVKVHRLSQRPPESGICGFSHSNISTRVAALLQLDGGRAHGGVLLVSLLAGSIGLVIIGTDPLHHLVEAVLGWLQNPAP